MHSFRNSLGVSIGLHALVVLLVIAVVNYHPAGMHLPSVDNPFAHAIAVSLMPHRHPQPKPQQKPIPQPKPKPQPPAIETQATEAIEQTPPPAQKPQPPTMPQEQQEEPQASPDYQQQAEDILNASKRYPREAVLAGTEGSVTLSYIVNSQGTVLAYRIEQSSGQAVLDDEVKRLIRSVRFPPFAQGDTDTRKTLVVTIEFSLHSQIGN